MVMRISSQTIYNSGVSQLNTLQSQLQRTQLQLSTGRRVLTPADDPVASARALEISQSKELNTQFVTNRSNARSSLSLVDQSLQNTDDLLQDVKRLIVNAGNPALSQQDRLSLATELEGRLDDLLGQANAADGTGGYLFSGYKLNTEPFPKTSTGATYQGDQGARELQVASSRKLPISVSGSAIYEEVLTGNGSFVTGAVAGNQGRGGTGIISPGSVTDTAALTGHQYTIDFTVVPATPGVPAVTTYTVNDVTAGTQVLANQPYKPGEPIAFDGMQLDIKGDPADLDQFTVDPSTNQSLFTTMRNLITSLQASPSNPPADAQRTNDLNLANQNINNALDKVLSVRASVGSGLKELDHLDSAGDDLNIAYEQQIGDLIDADPVETISRFTQLQTNLEAAQKSYKALTGLSLFNFI
ncbi:flagellar hook-associated protein FlgL [Pseudoduganella sp. OTU4001]|uniref:flagellar hook-associated protein FlgL n=1 Tax=Pseudoduganella sp. OTU4001 TaxID=3043854 RepID=UPI00313E2A84